MNKPRDYLALLEHSFVQMKEYGGDPTDTRLEFLANYIFDFTTYDGEMAEFFATKAVEVCEAIASRKTFAYIRDPENYRWYLAICNMPFFNKRLEWGTSIRGAWWSFDTEDLTLASCGLFEGDEQLLELTFSAEEWALFIGAVMTFARKPNEPTEIDT